MSNDRKPDEGDVHVDDAEFNPRAPFTRRTFLAATGGAVAAATVLPAIASGGAARAASPSPTGGGDPVQPAAILRIHPAIGVGRLGNADANSYFIGPEVPGYAPLGEAPGTAVPNYKTADGKVKRQAARFRIFEYRYVNGLLTPVREVQLGTDGVAAITWTVHLANKKASFYQFEGGQGERSPAAPLRNAAVTDPTTRRNTLEIDFGPRSIAGALASPVPFTPATSGAYPKTVPLDVSGQPIIPYLGELRTDAAGRLIVVPAEGKTGYSTANQPEMPHWANNDGWFDDASDGPVTAVVTLAGGQHVQMDVAGKAWVLNGPPDFAPGVPCSVTAWDLLFNVSARSVDLPANDAAYAPGGALHELALVKADFRPGQTPELPTYVPNFTRDIEPILVAAYNLWWVNGLVTAKHNSLISPRLGDPAPRNDAARKKVFSYMRPPLGAPSGTGPRTMPKLMGDDPYIGSLPDAIRNLALTNVQYAMLARWSVRAFSTAPNSPVNAITPHGLDRAALENCVGGAFFPGIEFGWQMRNPENFIEPFRIDHTALSGFIGPDGQPLDTPLVAGHFSRQMAVPWQADFNDCRNEGNYGWWPSQRPAHALPAANAKTRLDWARPNNRFEAGNAESTRTDMVKHWHKFGFVLEDGNQFIEKERAASIP